MTKNSTKKAKVLSNVGPELSFNCIDGSNMKSLRELAYALSSMSDDSFYYHVSSDKNDFGSWVKDVFNEPKLADNLTRANGRLESSVVLLKHIVSKLQ